MATYPHLLTSPVEYLKGVGPQRAELLRKELQIFTFGDLLLHFPFRYIDRTQIVHISQLFPGQNFAQVTGKLVEINVEGDRGNKRLKAYISDGSGELELVWFQGLRWIEKMLEVGKKYIVFGKPNLFRGEFSMVHPDISPLDESNQSASKATGLQPVYSSTEKLKSRGLHSRGIEKLIKTLLVQAAPHDLPEILPESVVRQHHFPGRFEAFQDIHTPPDEKRAAAARNRFVFEELFFAQCRILRLRQVRKKQVTGILFGHTGEYFHNFYHNKLPFGLTGAQKRVVREIRNDTRSGHQMNRLLQGDVGSGKTIVAFLTMLMAAGNGYQSAMMVPTELLAQQHYRTLTQLAGGLGIQINLLTASVKGASRKAVLHDLEKGNTHIVVGTHALLEDRVKFHSLGLVIIDEQHRFGVEQRAKLWTKNHEPPHVLVMTATPIPRTLAMTVYGDLDVSTIDELPPGRKPVTTAWRTDASRLHVFGFVRQEVRKGRQAYIVYPLIEESATLDHKYLMDGYESVSRAFPLPEFAVSIVHGQMKPEDREWEMNRFVKGETQIMVATTVIEVGVDVPNATVMIIESAERFGLSQLHQLRGRVGRGAEQSYCILMTGNKLSEEAKTRMQIMAATNDGFRIAEEDLRIRGPGDMEGTQQSGLVPFKIAELYRDQRWLMLAREAAENMLASDPDLGMPQHEPVRQYLNAARKGEKNWTRIS